MWPDVELASHELTKHGRGNAPSDRLCTQRHSKLADEADAQVFDKGAEATIAVTKLMWRHNVWLRQIS